jgi:hypothetical protein
MRLWLNEPMKKNTEISIDINDCRQLLGEPVGSYFTDSYNTLISVVQGVALAALCYVIQDTVNNAHETTAYFWLKSTLCLLVICVIWHSYIFYNQFIAWRVGACDSVIPMMFAILQIVMVATISKGPRDLCWAITLLFLWGIIAYTNTSYRYTQRVAKDIYRSYFSKTNFPSMSDSFAENLLNAIIRFSKLTLRNMAICTIISALLLILLYVTNDFKGHTNASNICVLFWGFVSASLHFFSDLRRFLNKQPGIRTPTGW